MEEFKEISSLPQRERTLGDGMDNSLVNLEKINVHDVKMSLRLSNIPATFKPIEPQSKIFKLIPKYVPKERKQPKYLIRKPKEPKFIPYEPYKAAVEPIIPHKVVHKRTESKSSRNNVEIQELVSQMSELRAAELNKNTPGHDQESISRSQWDQEKEAYETDIKNLRETNAHLENQLKFQAQVNSELKTLLVAAVGEDLESRVQHLTEDKLQLARALLNSANHLTSHQEQTEWLSGQCEVWRSKFLASSLMVEELARWKSALSTRINELQETVKGLLDDRYRIQKKSLKTCCYLQGAVEKLTSDEVVGLKTSSVIELASLNSNLSRLLSDLLGANQDGVDRLFEQYFNLPQYTVSERNALKLLQNPVTISNKQDAICNALMGAALSLSGEQKYLQHPSTHASCCSHCTGEIKDI